jgi:hypothetical protein
MRKINDTKSKILSILDDDNFKSFIFDTGDDIDESSFEYCGSNESSNLFEVINVIQDEVMKGAYYDFRGYIELTYLNNNLILKWESEENELQTIWMINDDSIKIIRSNYPLHRP